MERQSILKSLGDSKGLQTLIDNTKAAYRKVVWGNFFDWKDTASITYETVIGESDIGAAASVVAYDTAAPIRTRRSLGSLSGEIPSLRQKFQMNEKDLQDYLSLKRLANADEMQLINLVWKDVKNSAEAPHKRLDIFVLEAISKGTITLDSTTNPDGIRTEKVIDFQMPSANKLDAAATWATGGATSKPITDIMNVVKEAEAKGVVFEKMLMRRGTFNNLRKADETREYITGFKIGAGESKVNLSLNLINEFMIAEGLPRIAIVDRPIEIEKDGVISTIHPFADNNVSFLPAGKLGDMLNAPIVEELFPAKHVSYAKNNRVLLKKWSETDPISEFTGCELNAFPSWKNVNKCFILNTQP